MAKRSEEGRVSARGRRRKAVTPRRREAALPTRPARVTRLSRELNEALQQQAAMAQVLRVISSSPGDLQRVFDTLLENARRLCDAEFGNIYRWDGDALHLIATHNTPPAFAAFRRRSPFRPGPTSLVGRMVKTKSVTHVPDARDNPDYIERRDPSIVAAIELGGVRTYLAVPMLKENKLIGAFTVYRQEVRPFTDKQIALITSFASQAVIAIENARLLTELRQRTDELGRSVEELRALGEVSRAVNSTLDLETVLSTIVTKAVQLSRTDAGAIYVFDASQQEFSLRASYGMNQELIDAFTHRRFGLEEMNVALTFARGEPVQVADLKEEAAAGINEITLRAGYRSRMVAPLIFGNEPIGILVVRRRAPGRFTKNSVDLIKTFAAQSGLAIRNARLFESVEAHTRELAKSLELLERERNNKLMNLEAMVASIGHEVKQPLAAIASNGSAALRFVAQTPPNLEEVRSTLNRIVRDSHRASQVFDNIRALFGRADQGQEPIDVNELVAGALQALRQELDDHGITTHAELRSKLPLVMGHRGQLQEVFINLVRNAIEAMDALKDDRRILQVRAERHSGNTVRVAVEDSGPGIDPKRLDSIFDAFVTTKPQGLGLGLAICRMIVERHSGQLSATPVNPRGSVFQVVLPTGGAGVVS
jgi:signal transduction histidine kinase